MIKQTREQMLANNPIFPLFVKLAIPSIIGMMVQAFYNITDRYFVGNIPEVGGFSISGIGVVAPILFIVMGVSMLFGIGGGANISIKMGQNDKEGAERVLGSSVFMLFVVGCVLNITFLVFAKPILNLFAATPENYSYALTYFRIIIFGNFWNNFAFAFNHLIRAEGNSKRAMYSMIIGAGFNIVLDIVFIQVFNWGVAGAAYATIIAQFLSFIVGASYFIRRESTVELHRKYIQFNRDYVVQIVAVGFAPFFMQIAGSFIGAILNNTLVTYGGTAAQGAYAIIISIVMMFFMPVFGMNQALQPIIGYNYGAKNYARVLKTNNIGIITATIVMVFGWLLIQLIPDRLVGIMTKDAEITKIATEGIRLFMMMMPLIGIQIINTNLFQSIGKARVAFLLSLSRQVILLIPLLLILPKFYGLFGIWYSVIISDFLSFLLSLGFMLVAYRRMRHQDKANLTYN